MRDDNISVNIEKVNPNYFSLIMSKGAAKNSLIFSAEENSEWFFGNPNFVQEVLYCTQRLLIEPYENMLNHYNM